MDLSQEQQLELLDRLGESTRAEGKLTGDRMTWVMTLNGLLFAAIGVMVANRASIVSTSGSKAFALFITGVAAAGAACNLATIYSNYWADAATRGADAAFSSYVLR